MSDDAKPVLQVWDLRKSAKEPLAELAGHSKGVLSCGWCPGDPGLLLSSGKDSKTLLWDLYSGKVVFELPNGVDGNSDKNAGAGTNSTSAGGAGGGLGIMVRSLPKPKVLSAYYIIYYIILYYIILYYI